MDHLAAATPFEVALKTMDIIPYVMRVMAAEIRASEHAAAYSHVAILGILTARPHTLSDLADRNAVSAPTMSSTINTLEERGWVRRKRDLDDRRVVWIEITDAGLAAVEEINRHTAERIARLLTTLEAGERSTVLNGLTALRDAFAASLDEEHHHDAQHQHEVPAEPPINRHHLK